MILLKLTIFPLFIFIFTSTVFANRPLETDDAGVAEVGEVEVQTWIEFRSAEFENWLGVSTLIPFIPYPVEFSVEFAHGYQSDDEDYSIIAPELSIKTPILQAATKGTGWIDASLVLGTALPYGRGFLKEEDWGGFGTLAMTTKPLLKERWLIHLNLGTETAKNELNNFDFGFSWGLAHELVVHETTSFLFELYERVSNSDFVEDKGGFVQLGLRTEIVDGLSVNGGLGRGLWGDVRNESWGSLGLVYTF